MVISKDGENALKETIARFRSDKDKLQDEIVSVNADISNLNIRKTNIQARIATINITIDAIRQDLIDGGIPG